MDDLTLGHRVLIRRRQLGLSQQALADQTGITANNIARLERGIVQQVRSGNLVKLAAALDTTPNDLLGWQDVTTQ